MFAYGEPDENIGEPEALLEILPLGETTISHHLSRISVFLDVSKLAYASKLRGWPFSFRFLRKGGALRALCLNVIPLFLPRSSTFNCRSKIPTLPGLSASAHLIASLHRYLITSILFP